MSEWFPERQISAEEAERLLMLCGGVPPLAAGLDFFLSVSGKTAFSDEAVVFKNLLKLFGERFAEIMDIPETVGSEIFVKGALFYAGVFTELYPHQNGILADDYHLRALGSSDLHVNSWAVSERIQEEVPSYCRLFEQTVPAMNIETSKERNLALIGSGVVHAVAVDSLRSKQLFEDLEEGFNA